MSSDITPSLRLVIPPHPSRIAILHKMGAGELDLLQGRLAQVTYQLSEMGS